MKQSNIDELISKQLKSLRIKAGFTSYEKFAISNNLARKYYWMAESGKTRFTVKYLAKVLSIHKISLSDFFKTLNN